jgi:spore coat polysaccharide biosynthesis protein SpsF (cytidylyltransferase family)/aryl-alcohol dehydrogenase-like predicted oxidoreductase
VNHCQSTTVIIQSRLASKRLPAKALLPIAGIPAVVLCAKRAANSGLRVIVATSDSSSDDSMVEVLKAAGVECVRGSHLDVLLRFAQATSEIPETELVVRLTADNVFPDGAFVEAIVGQFDRGAVDYLGCSSPHDGLPYGMSAEAFSVKALRRAAGEAHDQFDREHVTPWIKRFCVAKRYVHAGGQAHWSRLRCTLDTFEDYEMLSHVFSGIRDPVSIGWEDLVGRLTTLSLGGTEPRCPFRERADARVHSVLTLGAAQLGSVYGIANINGIPPDDEVRRILAYAADAGITSIDTAAGYGRSEEQIGRHLPGNFVDQIRIITKLDVLEDVPADTSREVVGRAVEASVFKSLHRLRRCRLDTLLLHRWAHHDAWDGAAWDRLLHLKRRGVIGTLGASVSYPSEAIEALSDPHLGHLQCPVNILDGRWRDSEFLAKATMRTDVVIHARSVLLQGLLMLPPSRWITVPGVDSNRLCATLDELADSFGRIDRLDLCLAYVLALPWVTSLVVGVESVAQLRLNLRYVRLPKLSPNEMDVVAKTIPTLPMELLNPAFWRSSNA